MAKLVISLTDKQLKAAITNHRKEENKSLVKLADGNGLFFLIDKKGYIYWRFDYTRPISKKRNSISFGTYPDVSLAEAREKRAEYRKLIAREIDPAIEKQKVEEKAQFALNNTFKAVAEEYRKTEVLEPSTQRRNEFVWTKLYMAIGNYPISDITATQILDACRLYEKQGKTDSAKRMRSKASQVYRYAIALGLCQFNVGQLLRNIDQNFGRGEIVVDYAIKILPHVFVRPGELRAAKWADIDFENRLWKYTPPKTKNQTALEHIVPLSDQVFSFFKDLYVITGQTEYCFTSMRNSQIVISDSTIDRSWFSSNCTYIT